MATAADASVRDAPDSSRYELVLEGEVVGEIAYRRRGETVELVHTEVSPSLAGGGFGGRLVGGALDDLRARGLSVVPTCSFVAAYLRRHPEYGDLVAA